MKKHFDTPRRPWDKEKLEEDKELIKKYGLRRKQEIYRAETLVRQIRRRARKLFAARDAETEKVLFKKTYDMGLTEEGASLDRILELKPQNILERRLQTLLVKKALANTPMQARQFITHGHISAGGKKVTSPSYIVPRTEEDTLSFSAESTLNSKFKYTGSKEKPKEPKNSKKAPEEKNEPLIEKIIEDVKGIEKKILEEPV